MLKMHSPILYFKMTYVKKKTKVNIFAFFEFFPSDSAPILIKIPQSVTLILTILFLLRNELFQLC